jgi:hypothetical protein
MRDLIELICGVECEALPQLPKCHPARLPVCVEQIRFRIERAYSEPNRPAKFYALITIVDRGTSFISELVSIHSFSDLRLKLRKFLEALVDFEVRAGRAVNRTELAA